MGASSLKSWLLVGLIALCAWHLALRRHGLALPLTVDEGEYACAARAWAEGGLPYRDSASQKPPMIFAIYRTAYALLPENPLAPRILALAAGLATMLLLWGLTPAGWNVAARLCAPAVFGVLSTTPLGSFGFPANTEIFLCLFTALSAWCLKLEGKAAPLLAGVAAGAAFMTKQTAAPTIAAFAILAVWRAQPSRRRRAAALFLAGTAAIPVLWLGYFAWRGEAAAFIDQAWLRNLRYSSIMISSGAAAVQARWLVAVVAPLFLIGDWPIWAAALLALRRAQPRPASLETLATLWLAAGLLGAITGFFLFPYYFLQALPPLALAAAAGAQKCQEWWPRLRPAAAWLALFCLYPPALRANAYFRDPPATLARRLLWPNPTFESQALADYVRQHSRADERLYIYGSEAQIYVYARRRPATAHVLSYPLTLFPRSAAAIETELRELARVRPKFIIYSNQPASTLIASSLGEEFRDGLRLLLERDYRWVGQVNIRPQGTVYRLGGEHRTAARPDWSDESSLFLFELR